MWDECPNYSPIARVFFGDIAAYSSALVSRGACQERGEIEVR